MIYSFNSYSDGGADLTPLFSIAGNFKVGEVLIVYADSACQQVIGSGEINSVDESRGWKQIEVLNPLAEGNYVFSHAVSGSSNLNNAISCKAMEQEYRAREFRSITSIEANSGAFAAVRADGSVITWGDGISGGDSSSVAASLDGTVDVVSIQANEYAFAAIRADGSVITWGNSGNGGDSSSVAASLDGTVDVVSIQANPNAFAAIRADGSVVTWGYSSYGGDSSSVTENLDGTVDVVSVQATRNGAFAAISADGSVITWGYSSSGGRIFAPFITPESSH
jgi:D-arabinose 1-dehydrogenase-like Zn-dependent alcohol dehydrogenase